MSKGKAPARLDRKESVAVAVSPTLSENEDGELQCVVCFTLTVCSVVPHVDDIRMAKAASLKMHGSPPNKASSKKASTGISLASSMKPDKLNSFEAALAEKGITLRKALEKTASPSKQQYLADLECHRVL
jgi:hypothetical protein